MTTFIALAALLTLLVSAWLLRPLLRTPRPDDAASQRLNAAIYRDQLQTLEHDLAQGRISPADFEATRDELQLRLLDDTQASPSVRPHADTLPGAFFWTPRRSAALLALVLPLGAAGMYAWLGTPAAIDPVVARQGPNAEQVIQMVEKLAARLQANPDNPMGWAMLARSYRVLGRLEESEQAFARAGKVLEGNPDLLVDYADVLAARAAGAMEGRPLQLVQQALALDPQHPMGLMLSAVAAYRRADYALAATQWDKLLPLLPPGSPDAQQIEADIADARAKAGLPAAAKPQAGQLPPVDPRAAGGITPDKINQMVERLAQKLKDNPTDLEGWARLARAYKVLGRLEDSELAYEKAAKVVDSNPDLLAQYADLLALRSGKGIEGKALEQVNKALRLNPKHPLALMMAGSGAYQRADYRQAIGHWETALTVLAPGSEDARRVQEEIALAKTKVQ